MRLKEIGGGMFFKVSINNNAITVQKGNHKYLFLLTLEKYLPVQYVYAQEAPAEEAAEPVELNISAAASLTEALDLLAACNKVVTNDSGLMHIAAAVGTPLVAVYGSTSTGYTPPLSQKVQVVQTNISCRPCFKKQCPLKHLKCLTELSPEMVWQALAAL